MQEENISNYICLLTFVVVLLVIMFVISPLKDLFMIGFFFRGLIFVILGVLVYLTILTIDNTNFKDVSSSNVELIHIHQRNLIYKYTFIFSIIFVICFLLKRFL